MSLLSTLPLCGLGVVGVVAALWVALWLGAVVAVVVFVALSFVRVR